jgi:hypothetical protein
MRRLMMTVVVAVVLLVLGASSAVASSETPAPWWGVTAGSRPSDLRPGHGSDEVEQVTVSKATGGEFELIDIRKLFKGEGGVALIAWDASATDVQSAVEAVYGAGNVRVTGGPASVPPSAGEESWSYTITFTGALASQSLPDEVFAQASALEGAESSVNTTEVTKGSPDGQLVVEAENLGDAPAQGKVGAGGSPIVVTDTLPAGLTAVGAGGVEGGGHFEAGGEVECEILEAGRKVKCTYEGVVPTYVQIEVLISVRVDADAKTGEVNSATVSGGGATSSRTATHAIEVNGSERFGVENYSLVPENLGGSVDTQAGSHPFQVTSVITANSTYNVGPGEFAAKDEGHPRTVALVKDYIGELPAGLVGNPTPIEQCTDAEFDTRLGEVSKVPGAEGDECPAGSAVGVAIVHYAGIIVTPEEATTAPIFNMVPGQGEPARFAFETPFPVFLNASVRTGSDYGVTISSHNILQIDWLQSVKLTFWGVPGSKLHEHQHGWECLYEFGACTPVTATAPPPFLIMPTSCSVPWVSTLHADSWAYEGHSADVAEPFTYDLEEGGHPLKLDGCNHLPFEPSITVTPDAPDASSSTGLNVGVHVPQTAELNPEGLAESTLRNTTVTLPAGVAVNPSGADGLEACSEGLVGYLPGQSTPPEELHFTPKLPGSFGTEGSEATLAPGVNFCPNASKIGEVTIKTPLLPNPVKGFVYLAAQNSNPFGSLVAMYAVAEDPVSGTTIKLPFNVSLNPSTGQLVATSDNSPELPFETAEFHFFGGERAPLATPSRCGAYTTSAALTPWSAEENPVTHEIESGETSHVSSTFDITAGASGGACPGASLPFSPTLTGGALNLNAGAFSPFTLTMTRKDGEQNLQSVQAHLPPGLSGVLSNIELCPEPQANLGECGANSLIGETTISVGVGSLPFTVSGGKFYLTGPYNGTGACKTSEAGCAPFGITFEVPAKAGPFDLERNSANPAGEDPCDCVIVRGKIEVNPITAAITITSNPPGTPDAIPTSIEGIPLEIQHVNAITTRGNFQFNPTNCAKMEVTGTIHSSENSTDTIGVPFQVTNCAVLGFKPGFKVSTSGKTSRANGASLTLKVTRPTGPGSGQANFASVKVDLPKQLPSRLTTLQKACPAKTFDANPAGCSAASIVGHAKVITPVVPVPLEGPAYFVSHGGEAFPNLIIVLQGYGLKLDVISDTFISKAGVTSGTLKSVPDAPFSSFELTLPEGKYSALAANGDLCKSTLKMPTAFVAQNGIVIKQSTPITATGCAKKAHKAKRSKHHPSKKKK